MRAIPNRRCLALLGALVWAFFPGTVAAVTDGCLRETIVELGADSYVTVDLRIRPNQVANVAFGRPGGGDDAAEWELQASADGIVRRTFSAAQIERTGRVEVTVTTAEPCNPDEGEAIITVTVGSLPSTDTVGSHPVSVFAPIVVSALVISLSVLALGRTRLSTKRRSVG